MKPSTQLALLIAPALAAGLFFAWVRLRSELGEESEPALTIGGEPRTHRVSEETLAASRLQVGRMAAPFRRAATDGRAHELAAELERGPVVLTFIQRECPCSVAAQPFFNRLAAAYRGATFLGVIDAEEATARRWATTQRVGYPLLLDPDLELVQACGVENSAYVVVVDPAGRIAAYWPGFSVGMLNDLSAVLARLTASAEQAIDTTEAPVELYTGCPYLF